MTKQLLTFSTTAQAEWDRIYNAIELSIGPGGEFCNTRDYASKVAENIARLAACMHAFEGYEGTKISLATLNTASDVVLWYTNEYVRLFTPPSPQEVIRGYAITLDNWFIDYVRSGGCLILNRNDVLQLGPNKLRHRDILNIAIQRLIDTGRILSFAEPCPPFRRGNWKATQKLQLNDAYYGAIARGFEPWNFPLL